MRCFQCSLVLSLLLSLPLLSRHKIGTSSKCSWLQDCEFVELSLPEDVVSALTVNSLKGRFDRHCLHLRYSYNCEDFKF